MTTTDPMRLADALIAALNGWAEPARELAVFCAAAHPLAPEILCDLLSHDPDVVPHSSSGIPWDERRHGGAA